MLYKHKYILIDCGHNDTTQFRPSNYLIISNVDQDHFFHPSNIFEDTNNLSLVTFVQYNGLNIIFPGDLEKEGWLEFLKNNEFISLLRTTNVFLASHHGRDNGYCEEIFNFCEPDIILISDESIKYDTQKDVGYAKHSRGINLYGNNKKVITTRNNGIILLLADTVGGCNIHYQYN